MGKKPIYGEALLGKRKSIWTTLSGIQGALELPDAAFARLLRVDEAELLKMRAESREPSVYSGMSLCDQIGVGFDLLLQGRIDLKALALQHGKDPAALPEKYLVGAMTRRAAVVNFLDFVQQRLGAGYRSFILRQFQVGEAAFQDPLAPVNVRLGVDIAAFLRRRFADDSLIVSMGQNSAQFNRHTSMGQELSQARNLRELFCLMAETVAPKYLTKNYSWGVSFPDNFHCIVEGTPNRKLISLVGEDYLLSKEACLVNMGLITSIPCYLGYPPVAAKQISCMAQGDKSCRYDLDFLPLVRGDRKLTLESTRGPLSGLAHIH